MNHTYFYLAIGLTLTLASCKEELQPQASSGAVRAEQSATPANQKAATVQNTVQTAPATTTNAAAQTQGPLNPAHGQPGHRCDLAVGAPLNPGATANPASAAGNKGMTAQAIQTSPQIVSTPAKTAKGMNPPHGQPGHVCGIPVGAPLNSKPTGTPAATNTTNAYTVTPTNGGTPSLLAPPPAATATQAVETAPGMNPPHGQPGHVCGTPVGAPLNGDKKEEKKSE